MHHRPASVAVKLIDRFIPVALLLGDENQRALRTGVKIDDAENKRRVESELAAA